MLGLVPQALALYEDLSAEKNLSIFGSLYGLSGKRLKLRISALLEQVQLVERRRDCVKDFSGGMKRRLNIAAALLHEPEILLCDEPTVGVDPQSRNAIFDLLQGLNRSGMTVIYTTHYMEEAERLCPRLAIIDHGRIIACGTQADLLAPLALETQVVLLPGAHLPAAREAMETHGKLAQDGDRWLFTPASGFKLSAVYALIESRGWPLTAFLVRPPSLETLFLHLTGRTLRE
ncbi:MAG: ABC transporter ATP-binding protein [Verrucomicrobiota bacterium]|nr:ABC transporter ATP-binding protein [Verrucomicrobiota bacterium]